MNSPPSISPVPSDDPKPFWSVMVPNYNSGPYLIHTLRSVLAQDPGPAEMHIEILDNASTKDDPGAVLEQLGTDRIALFHQPRNIGVTPNFNSCIDRARGSCVHILCSDDIVLPGFYRRMQSVFESHPEVGAAFCRYLYMDENGNWQRLSPLERTTPGILCNWIERIAVTQAIQSPAIVVRRSVYEKLGGFHPDLFYTLDWEMWKRIAVHYPVWYEPETLACYRVHSSSDSANVVRSGSNVMETCRSIEISRSYLPAGSAARLSERARENVALMALTTARRLFNHSEISPALRQVQAAVKCHRSQRVIWKLIQLSSWCLKRTVCKFPRILLTAQDHVHLTSKPNTHSAAQSERVHHHLQP